MLHHRSGDTTTPQASVKTSWTSWSPAICLTAISTAMCPGWLALGLLSMLSLSTQAFNSQLLKCLEDPQYEELVRLAQDGLRQTAERKQVVVIGAGMAGLTAAKTLQDAGHQVHDGGLGRERSGWPQRAGLGSQV